MMMMMMMMMGGGFSEPPTDSLKCGIGGFSDYLSSSTVSDVPRDVGHFKIWGAKWMGFVPRCPNGFGVSPLVFGGLLVDFS